jgi:hypothetical protein
MKFSTFSAFSLPLIAAQVQALPLFARAESVSPTETIKAATATSTPFVWDEGRVDTYTIHQSCNATNKNQLVRAFQDLHEVASHARDHILRFGNTSEIFIRYFGEAASAEPLGWFSRVADGDKSNLLFRCDDIDGNCKNDGWAGHWRGENGTDETVICDLSYSSRIYNDQLCSQGYTVSGSTTASSWAGDLMHRLFHTQGMGELVAGHYADSFEDCLELAKTNHSLAVRNSATLRYFAIDAYTYDISVPGIGCLGDYKAASKASSDAHAPALETSSVSEAKASEVPSSTPSNSDSVTTTATAGAECHTHADGVVHCS